MTTTYQLSLEQVQLLAEAEAPLYGPNDGIFALSDVLGPEDIVSTEVVCAAWQHAETAVESLSDAFDYSAQSPAGQREVARRTAIALYVLAFGDAPEPMPPFVEPERCPACGNEQWRSPHNCTDGPPRPAWIEDEPTLCRTHEAGACYAGCPDAYSEGEAVFLGAVVEAPRKRKTVRLIVAVETELSPSDVAEGLSVKIAQAIADADSRFGEVVVSVEDAP